MGYRSCGVIGISAKTKTILLLAQKKLPQLMLEDMIATDVDDKTYYQYSDLKMYDSYGDVKEFNNFMDELEDEEIYGNSAYGYIRIGEESDDIEKRGDTSEFELYTETIITTPF